MTITENLAIAKASGGTFNFINTFLSFLFGSLVGKSPLWGLIIISLIITLIVTLAYKYLTDQTLMKNHKEETKKRREDMKTHKDSPDKMMELQKRSLEISLKMMKHSMRPMIFTFLPLIIMFGWLRIVYKGINLNFLGFIDGWIWVYIIFSMVFSILLRKLLKVH